MEHAEILLVVGPLIHEGTELVLNCYFCSGILQYKHTCSIKPKYLVNCFKKTYLVKIDAHVIMPQCNICIRIKSTECTQCN